MHKWLWILWLLTMVSVNGESPGVLENRSLLRFLNRHSSNSHPPKNQWARGPHEDSYWHSSGHGSYPLDTMEGYSEQSGFSTLSQDYRKLPSANANFTSGNYYGSSKPFLTPTNGMSGPSYQDSTQGSHFNYQYHQMRPVTSNYVVVKKNPTYHLKGNLQGSISGIPKHKKTVLQPSLPSYLKSVYPKLHKPYAKHKYPTQKIVHPVYRQYYQSPYQRYAIHSKEILRPKSKYQSDIYHEESTSSPISISPKRYTTERMHDTYLDGSASSEDYSGFNDTDHKISNSYYETYEEVEKATSEPDEASYDESTTRGYYGDRIYMSTQVPLVTSDKSAIKNKFFVIRKTSHDDDIETIFE